MQKERPRLLWGGVSISALALLLHLREIIDWASRVQFLSSLDPYVGSWKDATYGHFMRWLFGVLAQVPPAIFLCVVVVAVALILIWAIEPYWRKIMPLIRPRLRRAWFELSRAEPSRIPETSAPNVISGARKNAADFRLDSVAKSGLSVDLTQQQKRDKVNARLRKALTDTFAEMKDQENRAVDQIIAWEEQSVEKSSPLTSSNELPKPDSALQIAGEVEEFLEFRSNLAVTQRPLMPGDPGWPYGRTSTYERETAKKFNQTFLTRVRALRASLIVDSEHAQEGDSLIERGASNVRDVKGIMNHITYLESGRAYFKNG